MTYINIGKIVNTHGIKGELRLLSHFPYKDKVFLPHMTIYIGASKTQEEIVTYRKHKNFDMITLKGYTNINEVLKYKGLPAYVNRDDLHLQAHEYLDEDLIGLEAYSNNIYKGRITKVEPRHLVIQNEQEHYLVPKVSEFIQDINLKENKIIIKYMKGLFNDENK